MTVTPAGDLDDASEHAFRDQLLAAVAPNTDVTLDMQEVTRLGSAAVGVLAMACHRASGVDGSVQVVNLSPSIRHTLAAVGSDLGGRHVSDSPLVLATHLARHWATVGQLVAGRETLERALDTVAASDDERGAALRALADLATAQGDMTAAIAAHREAIAIADAAGDRAAGSASRYALAVALLRVGAADEARAEVDLALEAFRDLGDPHGEAFARSALGLVARAEGSIAEAFDHLLDSLRLFRTVGARREAAAVLANLGNLADDVGDALRAARFFDGARQLFAQLGDARGEALCVNNLSLAAERRSDLDHAVELGERALTLFRAVHDLHGEAAVLNNLAGLWEAQGATDEAAALYGEAVALFARLGDASSLATAQGNLDALRPPPPDLSRRERQVASLVAEGLSNRAIAERLFISQRTVDSHLAHMFTKLALSSRTQLAMWAARHGLAATPPTG